MLLKDVVKITKHAFQTVKLLVCVSQIESFDKRWLEQKTYR